MKPFRRAGLALSILSALSVLPLLTACGEQGKPGAGGKEAPPAAVTFQNTDLTGLEYAKGFELTDHTGKPRTLADFKGKLVFIFFGYTQCPDVCPTTMMEMAQVMKELGPLADKVQVLFVTLDPARDTQALLAQYVPGFDPRFLGLRGDQAATEKTAKEFKVFFQKVPGATEGNYTVDHTYGSFVFDREGKIRLFVRHGKGTAPIVHDLRQLLR